MRLKQLFCGISLIIGFFICAPNESFAFGGFGKLDEALNKATNPISEQCKNCYNTCGGDGDQLPDSFGDYLYEIEQSQQALSDAEIEDPDRFEEWCLDKCVGQHCGNADSVIFSP